ncbi:MAG: phosphodiester glycosidase family protein [Acidobacteriia bacterium]|nr:phosphodiester glycosidase family protein [Terriglobia bacterium]
MKRSNPRLGFTSFVLHAILALILFIPQLAGAAAAWQNLSPGVELGTFPASHPGQHGDSQITILRIDPKLWDLTFVGLSQGEEHAGMTAREWSRKHNLAAAITAGMFLGDNRTHAGYLRYRDHVNNSKINAYRSVAAFDARSDTIPRFRIFDLDAAGVSMQTILRDYSSAVQNLRLIKRPGQNRWAAQDRMWSEAALGEDRAGRILFIFTRSPFKMDDLNRELLALDIGLVCAQHLEGGPEAQLYVGVGGADLQWFGSYEMPFQGNDKNQRGWPVPNVLGIRPRHSPK